MINKKLKNQKGITMTSLVIYMFIFIIVLGTLTTISTFFYGNIGEVIDAPKYIYELNKFIMFFGVDIKDNKTATVTNDTITFEDGTTYKFQDNVIYRDDMIIASYIMNCNFELSQYTAGNIDKNIIKVTMQIGRDQEDSMTKSIDFTLRYW